MSVKLKKLLLFLPVHLASLLCFSQRKVTGVVLDNLQTTVKGASINLYYQEDSSKTFKTISDSVGRFSLVYHDFDSATLILEVSHINYKAYHAPLNKSDSLLIVTLQPQIQNLQEVKVFAQRPTLERTEGKFVFNVANTPITNGNSVGYVLKRTPLLNVDQNGNLSIISGGVKVYINDRPTELQGDQLMEYLNNIPADNIVRIEIYPVTPAKFDGSGGAVNLVLRKLETDGAKGNVTISNEQAFYNSYYGASFLNYHHNRYTQTFTLNGGKTHSRNTSHTINERIGANEMYQNRTFTKNKIGHFNASTNIDYELSQRSNIGGMMQIQWNKNIAYRQNNEDDYVNGAQKSYENIMPFTNSSNLLASNVYYKNRQDYKNQLLHVNMDFLSRNNPVENIFKTLEPITKQPLSGNKILTSESLRNYALRIDFKKQVFKQLNWELGAKFHTSTTQSPYEYFILENNNWLFSKVSSVFFEYKERISSIYSTINQRFGKIDIKLGGRVEQTNARYGQKSKDKRLSTNYTNLIPVLNIGYAIDNNNLLSFDLGNYPSRPSYSNLNPFIYKLGSNFYQKGNPNLITSPALIGSLFYIWKRNYTLGLQYLHLSKSILYTNIYTGDSIISTPFNNVGRDQVFMATSIVNFPSLLKQLLKIRITQKFAYNQSTNLAPQLDIGTKAFSYNIKVDADYNFPKKGLQAFASIQYLPATNFGYLTWKPIFTLYAGIMKTFEKPQLKINMELNNLTRFGLKSTNRNSFIYSTTRSYDGTQGIRLAIIKTFGNQKSKEIDQKSIDDSRLKKESETKR